MPFTAEDFPDTEEQEGRWKASDFEDPEVFQGERVIERRTIPMDQPWQRTPTPIMRPEQVQEEYEDIGRTEEEQALAARVRESKRDLPPRQVGAFEAFQRGFGRPQEALGGAAYIAGASDKELEDFVQAKQQEEAEAGQLTGPGTVGETVGNILGAVPLYAAAGAVGRAPGVAAMGAAQNAYEVFIRSTQRAIAEGKSPAEAVRIGKAMAGIGAVTGAVTGVAGPASSPVSLRHAGRQGVGGGGAAGLGRIAENVAERELGLSTTPTEGALEAGAMMAAIPGATYGAGRLLGTIPRMIPRAEDVQVDPNVPFVPEGPVAGPITRAEAEPGPISLGTPEIRVSPEIARQPPSGMSMAQEPTAPRPVEGGIPANEAMLDLIPRGTPEPFQINELIRSPVERGEALRQVEELGQQIQRKKDFEKARAEDVSEAQRTAEETVFHPNKPLTENQLSLVQDSLRKAILENQLPGKNKGIIAGTKLEDWADSVLNRDPRARLSMNPVDVMAETIPALAIKGAAVLERGIRSFPQWAKEMESIYGEKIKPMLRDIYAQALYLKGQKPNATEIRAVKEGGQPERVGVGAQREAAETSRGDSIEQGREVPQATQEAGPVAGQVVLKDAIAQAKASAGAELKNYPKGGATGYMRDLGAKAASLKDVEALADFAKESSAKTRSLMKEGKFDEAMDEAGKQAAEAYEYATGVNLEGQPKWQAFENLDPNYKPSVPDPQYIEAKGGPSAAQTSTPVGGQLYMGIPDPIATAKAASTLVKTVIGGPIHAYSEWMTDRLARTGGANSKRLAQTFNEVTDREKQLYGALTDVLDPARKTAGRMTGGTKWLHQLSEVTDRAAIANTVGAIEGTIPVPAKARNTVAQAQAANLAIGRLVEPVIPGFVATGKFQRNLSAFGYDVLRRGAGKVWEDWTRGVALANNIPLPRVRAFFADWKAELDKAGPDLSRLEKINQDFAREFPKAVTHVKVGEASPSWEQVVHADLFNYLENAARRATHIRAFREKYPMTPEGQTALQTDLEGARSELSPSYQKDLDAVVKALHGHPTDSYSNFGVLSPDEPTGAGFRMANQTVGNLMAKGVLTGQMFVQPGENIAGATPVFLGYPRYLKAAAKLRQLGPELERTGSINRVFYDMSVDPNASGRSGTRIAGNVLSKLSGQQLLNELQERHAAATAKVTADDIRSSNLSAWDKSMLPQTFKAMGFTEAQAREMMRGNPELLGQFERKAAAFLTGGNKAIAEGSRIGANRLFNSIFRFQNYGMTKANQLAKVWSGAAKAWESGTPSEKIAATRLLGRFMFGAAAQGALTAGITALFYEGVSGAAIRWSEAKDDPANFLLESFMASMSGPAYLVWRGAKRKGIKGVGEAATRAAFPYAMTMDMIDLAQGAGQYQDLDNFDKVGRFINQKLPGSRAVNTGMAMFGLSEQNQPLDNAIKAFYRWRRDELGFKEQEYFLKDENRAEFRTAMKSAVNALQRGDDKALLSSLERAAEHESGKGGIQDSFRARKLLKTPTGKALSDEQLDALRNRIGQPAFDKLVYFDAMLDELARTKF